MQLQTYAKIGICVGIGAAVIFTIIGIVGASNQLQENWIILTLDKDRLMEKMKVLPSVMLFAEKYPDHYYLENLNRHRVQLEMSAYDFETGNELRLDVNYDIWDEKFREYVRCDIDDNDYRTSLGATEEFVGGFVVERLLQEGRAEDQYAYDFIKYTNCLEIGSEDEPVRKVSSPEYGDVPTVRISVPEGSSVPGCEEIAHCFEPEEITVKVGDIVEWKNYDDAAHTVTSGGPDVGPTDLFDSGLAMAGETYAIKFEAVGDYPYFCMIHPWQTGTITVTK